ncbi:antitrypsin isoform X2 [Lasioglossum baleicum]|uniref:antitrypsin isoform X2 n=1 Tax=Lasioglossum baleicum TaxID=434251 RepID=UPI003FCE0FAB
MRKLKQSILVACLISLGMAASETSGSTEALRAVAQGTNEVSASLFQAVVQENPGNLIISPLSAAVVLAMAAYGAGGETERQLKSALHIPPSDKFGLSGYQELITALNSVKENKLLLANKAFVNDNFTLKPTYKALTENYFKSISESVNFGQSVQAADTINTWVKEKTNDRIQNIVTPGDLNEDTALVLVNAVYFKGMWKNKFDPQLTRKLPFHVDANVVKEVPTMFKRNQYNYGELPDMNAKFIEIPYQGDSISMVIILPNEVNGLAEVEKKIKSINLNDILRQGHEQEVELFLPKFKIENKLELNSPLQKIGLTDMFTDHANFSGIADAPIAVSKVVQKAFIEVNEEGSEAAAATGLILVKLSLVYPVNFQVNRPFYYNIIYKANDGRERASSFVSLFSGRVTEPKV